MHAGAALLLAATLAAPPLQVPFVAQAKDTCGPAALAMVMAFWGRPADHAALAGELRAAELRGVAGSRLAAAAQARGLQASAYRGDAAHLREQVAKGRPVIVAWEMKEDRAHNVVVVGFDTGSVVVHDPARGAFRRVPADDFDLRWQGAGYWSLLVTPR